MQRPRQRVVITGVGLISPLGNQADIVWEKISQGISGVDVIQSFPEPSCEALRFGGEARDFTGHISDFGELEKTLKRSVKKGLRLMCREIEMGVAASQLAIQQSSISAETNPAERVGTLFGSDYILSPPADLSAGFARCMDENGDFQMEQWGEHGINEVEPLWLLKYLPNMPASHVAIYNDLRGPSNSLTMREASSNCAIAEAVTTIRRGVADAMVAGATGTRIHPLKSVHLALEGNLAVCDHPGQASRPFDKNRLGMVLGEGAGAVIVESLDSAKNRSAHLWGDVVGYSSSTVADREGKPNYAQAFKNVLSGALENAGMSPQEIGHIHAHGLATEDCDRGEAAAIHSLFADFATPVVAAKSYMGNLGAGSGMVEIIASLKAMENDQLFPILNYETPDPECPIVAANPKQHACGDSFINLNVTPMGQASAIIVKRCVG